MPTVVVLPLVPVTVSHGAAPSAARMRQASSTSPQTGMPAVAAASMSGSCGGTPGEVTTSWVPAGGSCTCSGPRRTSTSRISRIVARSVIASVTSRDTAVTLAPRSASASAAGEAGDSEPDDEHVDPGPVGIAVGQPLPRLVGRVERHCDPTTHSA